MDFIDLKTQYKAYKDEIDAAIQSSCESANFILGPAVDQFEEEISSWLSRKYTVSCANGTDALQLAMMALEIGEGDEVITTPFTFFATVEVVLLLGATPVFVDIEEDTYNIDTRDLKNKITPQTKAILPVSLFGQPSNMNEINAVAADAGVHVIEDAAQSFGATYNGKKSGNLCHVATTSFFPAKPLGCYGDGGAVFTDDEKLVEKLKVLRNHGQTGRYEYSTVGLNSRLDALQAAVLSVKLKHFDDEIAARQKAADYYRAGIDPERYVLPVVRDDRTSAWAQFCLRSKERQKVFDVLQAQGIPHTIYYPVPIHLQPVCVHLEHRLGDFPVSESVSREIFAVPFHPFLTEEDQNKVIAALNEV